MKRIDTSLVTPIYVKQAEVMEPPKDTVYYLMAANGLYLCRNHPHYRSCVPALKWPTELARHAVSFEASFPPIPADEIERICGFFGRISDEYGAEAIALLAWDSKAEEVRTLVPRQVAAVGHDARGIAFPIGVKYETPRGLPRHWSVFCDIHSHCEMGAYASCTDVDDEQHLNGLHIVVGRLHQEPPEFHAEAVVDEARFPLSWHEVIVNYRGRRSFPVEWEGQVKITDYARFRNFNFT